MANYLDLENEKVKEYHETKTRNYKRFEWYLYGIIALYLILFIADMLNKLSVSLLFTGLFFSFCALVWYINSETTDLHNRINIIDDEADKLKQRVWTLELDLLDIKDKK